MVADRSTPSRAPSGRLPLQRDTVVAAALALVDREGLDRLSMRRLAGELGVEAMSLYHHVSDKSDLLDALVAAVLDQMVLPTTGPGDRRVEAIAAELRRVSLAHPAVYPLVLSRGLQSTSVLRPADALLGALRDGGLADDAAVGAFWTLLAFVIGSVACELGEQPPASDSPPSAGERDQAGEYPHVDALASSLFSCDHDQQFARGLASVVRAVRD